MNSLLSQVGLNSNLGLNSIVESNRICRDDFSNNDSLFDKILIKHHLVVYLEQVGTTRLTHAHFCDIPTCFEYGLPEFQKYS